MMLVGLLVVVQQVVIGQVQGGDRISQTELLNLLDTPDQPLILDVRTADEYADGHVPNAVNIHFRDLSDHLDELKAQNPSSIVVYCEVGVRAAFAERTLEKAGFDPVLHLSGDMRGWRNQDLPVDKPEEDT
jgi:rhodanese-related sulfurtransferase